MDTLDIMNSPNQELPNENPTENIDAPKPKKHRRSRYDPEPDWSAQMREKVSKSQRRVGQACDRCKLKKMKCTPDTDGCGCCRALNLQCKVTDRVTGETFVRGAAGRMCLMIENLDKTNGELKRENKLLKQEIAHKDHKNQWLEEKYQELKAQHILRDRAQGREMMKNNPFSDDFAYEDDLDTGAPQQDGVL